MNFLFLIYFLGSCITFLNWFRLFMSDSTTPATDRRSWKILLSMSISWPIAVPISLLELTCKSPLVEIRSHSSASPVNALPLGYLLKQAGLISESQVIQVLEDQQTTHQRMRIGEIIASYGWLKPETIDFFANSLTQMRIEPQQQIGQYLKLARLLNDLQIEEILQEQDQLNLRFGEIAVHKGWVKPETVDFVLDYLQDKSPDSPLSNSKPETLNLKVLDHLSQC